MQHVRGRSVVVQRRKMAGGMSVRRCGSRGMAMEAFAASIQSDAAWVDKIVRVICLSCKRDLRRWTAFVGTLVSTGNDCP